MNDYRFEAAQLLMHGWGRCIDYTSADYGGYARINDAKRDGTVSVSFSPGTAGRKHAGDFEPVRDFDLPDYVLKHWFS